MPLDLTAIRARAEAATPGPWRRDGNHLAKIRGFDGDTVARIVYESNEEGFGPQNEADATFIAHARTDIPALCAEVERLRDLVRHQRGPLHDAGLLTDGEYAELAADHGAVARLEGYDALRERIAALEAAASAVVTEWAMIEGPDHCPHCGAEDEHRADENGPCPVGTLQALLHPAVRVMRNATPKPAETGDCRTCAHDTFGKCARPVDAVDPEVNNWIGAHLSDDTMTRRPDSPPCPGYRAKETT